MMQFVKLTGHDDKPQYVFPLEINAISDTEEGTKIALAGYLVWVKETPAEVISEIDRVVSGAG